MISNFHTKLSSLEPPVQQPRVQRKYIASLPDRHVCTPQISHGFVPLDTSMPLPTLAGCNTNEPGFDYFSLCKKESVMCPDAVKYESHGFILLCSVAVG
jgi:hypothetical protein